MAQLSKIPTSIELAGMAIETLLLAFAKGGQSGHIEWEDIDTAFEYAKEAWPNKYEEICKTLETTDA